MKLQYLADSRDAFKWDLLHWLCTQSAPPFSRLVFVPLLTPDDQSGEGNIPHARFRCRPAVRTFVGTLGLQPRSLATVKRLGRIDAAIPFEVSIEPGEHYLLGGQERARYWLLWKPESHCNSLVFFDPDIGFETKSGRGTKYMRHGEAEQTLRKLPASSVVVVYQHRPRQSWPDTFGRLLPKLGYAEFVLAVHEANLAFLVLAKDPQVFRRVSAAVGGYCGSNDAVCATVLKADLA